MNYGEKAPLHHSQSINVSGPNPTTASLAVTARSGLPHAPTSHPVVVVVNLREWLDGMTGLVMHVPIPCCMLNAAYRLRGWRVIRP